MCKAIKNFFRKCDLFSVPFSFRYKNEDDYSTFCGGLFSIIFCIIALLFGINFFIAFCKRENFSLYFNSINLKQPEEIKFKKSEEVIAIRFDCDNNTDVPKLFQLEVKYWENKANDKSRIIPTPLCNETEYFKNHKDLDELKGLENLFCLDGENEIIKGVHGNDVFSYYEISIFSKEENVNHYKEIDNFLLKNDCKVELYFSDINMNFTNYSNPFNPFINEIFMQLNPDLCVKMNAFFMNQYFEDENSLIHEINQKKEKEKNKKIVFSRNEQYSSYKGMNRGEDNPDKPEKYKFYGKIFIRADTKRMEIKRKYPNLMEFYADTFSFWVAIFYLLYLLFYVINNFYAKISLEKNLFFFKGVENNYFNISKNNAKIESLIKLTKDLLNKNNNSQRAVRHFPSRRHNGARALHLFEQNSTEEQIREREDLNNRDIIQNAQINEEENNDLIKYSFNIFEFISMKLCKCCISKKLKRKKKLLTEANDFLYKKLDIIFYIRNMIFLDMINKVILGDGRKGINKLLITPIIFGKEKEEEIDDNYYEHYCENDFNNYYDEIIQLNECQDVTEIETKIVSLSNEQLKKMRSLD